MSERLDLLSDEDADFLRRKGWDCAVSGEGGEVQVVVRGYAMPPKYAPAAVDLLVRQLPGYPESGMDMFWTRPDVTLAATGAKPQNTEHTETYQGVPWQRWSRHMNGWRAGVDNLETFFAAIAKELGK